MRQDIKICFPLYKVVYSFMFVVLLSLVRGISNLEEIGPVMDTNMALLSIIICSDIFYQELKGGRWEVFSLISVRQKKLIILRRLFFEYGYLMLITALGYWFFYAQKPYPLLDANHLKLYGMAIVAITGSIIFFGGLSMALTNIIQNLWAGIGLSVIIWLVYNSKFGMNLPIPFRIFGFASRNFQEDIYDYSWIWGKLIAILFTIIIVIFQFKFIKKGKRC